MSRETHFEFIQQIVKEFKVHANKFKLFNINLKSVNVISYGTTMLTMELTTSDSGITKLSYPISRVEDTKNAVYELIERWKEELDWMRNEEFR